MLVLGMTAAEGQQPSLVPLLPFVVCVMKVMEYSRTTAGGHQTEQQRATQSNEISPRRENPTRSCACATMMAPFWCGEPAPATSSTPSASAPGQVEVLYRYEIHETAVQYYYYKIVELPLSQSSILSSPFSRSSRASKH